MNTPVFKNADSTLWFLPGEPLVLCPINVDKSFFFTPRMNLFDVMRHYRWFYRKGRLVGFDREVPTCAIRIEELFLGPLPWTSKLVFKNGDKQDYRDENLELVPLKTPRVSW